MIAVYRIGHRINRDKRVTTHVALVARAFGADKIFVDTKDKKLEETINSVCKRFGGDFKIETGVNRKHLLKQWNGQIIHLTMYGADLEETVKKIDSKKDILVIVGSEKVPGDIYEISDFNISVGNQPHSEIAALALFLDRYTNKTWLKKDFKGELKIIPMNKGKKIVTCKK
ncbi:MAG: tRNA (cytidine(56)-2'-O)-methyltransferase [Candidatus Thermoplasmatota archaeon]